MLPTSCPQCGRDAPVVYRGLVASCAACGAPRLPLSGPSFNLAGKPSKVGGAVTSVLGWLVLLFGLFVALFLGLLLHAISTLGISLAVALPILVLTLGLGIPLVLGGKALRRSGADAEREMREQALLSMLSEQGRVSAARAAAALGVRVEEADAHLTALAKRQPERVALDIDEDGTVFYRAAARLRVDEGAPEEEGEGDAAVDGGSRAREKTSS